MAAVSARLGAISLRLSSLEDKSELALFFFSPMQPTQPQPAKVRTQSEEVEKSLEAELEAIDLRLLGLEDKLGHMLSLLSSRPTKSQHMSFRTKLREEVQKARDVKTAEESQVAPGLFPPKGMARDLEVTEIMKTRQRRNPEQWTMTVQQWIDVVDHCKDMPSYQKVKEEKGHVSMYDVNALFVKPWTKGTGCGVAVLMSQETSRSAELMVSHAWAGDTDELRHSLVNHVAANNIPLSASIWFCAFANYQLEDHAGPSIKDQLELAPFGNIVGSHSLKHSNGGYGVLAVHTSQGDLYTRLWCMYEIECAVAQSDVTVTAAMSQEYEQRILQRVALLQEEGATVEQCLQGASVAINTSKAVCSNPVDERMLVRFICAQRGGFNALDRVISNFQKNSLPVHAFRSLIASRSLKLEDASLAAQADQQTVLAALRNDSNSMLHASKDLLRDPEILSLLAKRCRDKDKNGNTALHNAVRKNDDYCVRVLAQVGADLEAETNDGSRPLQIAVRKGNDLCIRVLVQLGADLQAKSRQGETALHMAAEAGQESSIRVLIELGAKLEARDNLGNAALHIASKEGNESCIRVLANLHADLQSKNPSGNTPLHIAAERGQESSIRALAELGADLEAKNETGNRALHMAAAEGKDSCIQLLAELGADVLGKNDDGETAAEIAAGICSAAAALQAKIVTVALLQALSFSSPSFA